MADEYPWRDAELLERLYWEEELTQYEIADRLDSHQSTIEKWMDRHDIDTRQWKNEIPPEDILEANEERKTIAGIADYLDEPRHIVRHRIKEHGIEIDHSLRKYDIDEETLRDMYHDDKMTIAEIADVYDCMPNTIRSYMIDYGIERRDKSEAISLARRSDIVFSLQYGYEIIQDHYEAPTVLHHRLLAVVELVLMKWRKKTYTTKTGFVGITDQRT